MTDRPVVVARVTTPRGELVLRRAGDAHELIEDGTFLMDTRDGRSERRLVEAALARHQAPHDVLIGGLGMGFSLVAALRDPRVRRVTVVEIEPVVVEWHATHLRPVSRGALDDPRVRIVVDDLASHLVGASSAYDIVCIDVDNGPEWTVTGANTALYDDAGTGLVVGAARRGGLVSVWAAAASPRYEECLRRHLEEVAVIEVPAARGAPDVIYVGRRPDAEAAARP